MGSPGIGVHSSSRCTKRLGPLLSALADYRTLSTAAPRKKDRSANALPAKFDLRPSLIRDFHRVQSAARAALAKERGIEIDKVEWPLGSVHDLRKSWCTQLAATMPLHVLQEHVRNAKAVFNWARAFRADCGDG